jgi:hypothetical protein
VSYRALCVGFALGLAFALAAPSCSSSTCSSTSCRGCCLHGAICVDPGRDAACGSGGGACAPCDPGFSCQGNQCVSGGVGASCVLNQECGGIGDSSAFCKLATNPYGDPYSGGYCTRPCAFGNDCPGGSLCLGIWRSFGEYDTACWKTCRSSADCRDGYLCRNIGFTTVGACWLNPLPMPDAGAPAPDGLIGSPCTSDDPCRNPPSDGYCVPEQVNGNPTGHVGGECAAPCDIDGDAHCGQGGTCVRFGTAVGFFSVCSRRCTNPGQGQSDCRAGYVCSSTLTSSDGGVSPFGYCKPDCNNPGAACQSPMSCRSGYCQ